MDISIGETVEFHDDGKSCGSYHYQDPFKSFFHILNTPGGKNVVAPVPNDHPHHKGLQFGLCASDVNFWEEREQDEPSYRKLPIGRQRSAKPERLSSGIGFSQQVCWELGKDATFQETRQISVTKAARAYVWTWQTTLIAQRKVEIIKSVWDGPGYCGLGLRLIEDLFRGGKVSPPGAVDGSTPTSVSFHGKGAEVTFAQNANQANVLFVSFYEAAPGFAFMALGPTNASPRTLAANEQLTGAYVVTVADL
jgi:hypothetical protein